MNNGEETFIGPSHSAPWLPLASAHAWVASFKAPATNGPPLSPIHACQCARNQSNHEAMSNVQWHPADQKDRETQRPSGVRMQAPGR
jgi:hypothetical protein